MRAIIKDQSPEEREYARHLNEIEDRKRSVADLQTQLKELNEELSYFSTEYHSRVGVLFVEIDKLDLAIAEYDFRITRLKTIITLDPDALERETHARFTEQRDELHHGEEETRRHQRTFHEERRRPTLDDASAAVLKSEYRELVKRFHPDLARTEVERQRREAVMKRVNAAFHDRDLRQLRSLLNETELVEDEAFESRSIADKLVWATCELQRLDAIATDLTTDIEALKTSELAVLWQRYQAGESVLDLLERDLGRQIEVKQRVLQERIEEFLAQAAEGNHVGRSSRNE